MLPGYGVGCCVDCMLWISTYKTESCCLFSATCTVARATYWLAAATLSLSCCRLSS